MTTDAPRVMLLAPQYWISGTVTLARELQRGWPTDWPKPSIACATRSGKPSTMWGRDVSSIKRATATAWRPDITGTADDVINVARTSFDLVHVTEPDIPATQREWWHDLLDRLPVPWTLTLNGNPYPDVDWRRILNSPRFTGVVWHTPGNVPPELSEASWVELVSLPRPYTLQYKTHTSLPRLAHSAYADGQVVGTHCRVAPNKGVALVLALSEHLGVQVCLDGAPQAGAAPYTIVLQQRYLGKENTVAPEAQWSTERVHYAGPFSDGVTVARTHDVHVSATRLGFSAGHEYSLLEAVDAGCVIVQPEHMTESGCPLMQHTYPWERRGVVGALNDEYKPLSDVVRAAISWDGSWYDQSHNRALVARHHDPDRLVREFWNAVASVI